MAAARLQAKPDQSVPRLSPATPVLSDPGPFPDCRSVSRPLPSRPILAVAAAPIEFDHFPSYRRLPFLAIRAGRVWPIRACPALPLQSCPDLSDPIASLTAVPLLSTRCLSLRVLSRLPFQASRIPSLSMPPLPIHCRPLRYTRFLHCRSVPVSSPRSLSRPHLPIRRMPVACAHFRSLPNPAGSIRSYRFRSPPRPAATFLSRPLRSRPIAYCLSNPKPVASHRCLHCHSLLSAPIDAMSVASVPSLPLQPRPPLALRLQSPSCRANRLCSSRLPSKYLPFLSQPIPTATILTSPILAFTAAPLLSERR